MATADAVVVGGGVTGTSAAFQLARRGRRVILVERGTVGSGPTGRTAGIIRLHYSYEPLILLAARSREVFARFEDVTGATCDFTRCGFLLLAPDREMDGLREIVAMQRRLGIEAEVLSPDEVAARFPQLATDDVAGAAWEPGSGFADGYATAAGFAAAARRSGADVWEGVTVRALRIEGGRVRGVETTRGPVDAAAVLVAAGPWTPDLLRAAGVDIPIQSSRQQVVHLAPPPGWRLPVVVEDMVLGLYARPEAGDTVLAGVLEEEAEQIVQPDAFAPGVDFEFVERIGRLWARRFPTARSAQVRGGFASLYDITPDWQPVLGPVPGVEGLFVAAGFSGHGFKLSPAVGEALAAVMVGEQPPVDVSVFRLSRFAEGRLIRGRHAQGILG
ncbi:MAG: FAD-binding oxidoreductase [Armatimonadota bacterium]|nr:FAD-binding oxidoreductase [Armatimonadota bacterium]MDR7402122.1 FAD-binding oxidoreductase [Armatimonadota bacterium]MDR7404099.1 FAD-binding oxidoreductase [Armatimonadota bacterium]MDR7437690.1 FAD-binding oxidoreductase [Armatimonadota bacterium]MDR7472397.1 FAD-binding oxidoreductase [Armatimonadota bacterium]